MTYSVVMTSFNARETIEKAIKSAFTLSPAPEEVIVVDDKSSDDTPLLLKKLSGVFPNLVVMFNDLNMGQSYSRNRGVNRSSTSFVVLMDDDDVSLPDRAREHLNLLKSGASLSFVSSTQVYPNGYRRKNVCTDFHSNQKAPSSMIRQILGGRKIGEAFPLFSPSSVLAFDKSAFDQIGGFDESLRRLEDIDLVIRAIQRGLRIAWSSKILVERGFSIGADKRPKANFLAEREVLERYKIYLSARELVVEKMLIKIRGSYFEGRFRNLVSTLPMVTIVFFLRPGKFVGFCKRLIHDIKRHG